MTPSVVFMGTPSFAATCLEALHTADVNIVGVYSQPSRASGRGKKITPTPVAHIAKHYELPVYTPEKISEAKALDQLNALAPDLIIVVAYGLWLPESVLSIPRFGCWNVHASLLPRWRGAAPIQRAIQAGDRQTGIDIIRMTKDLDQGPVLSRNSLDISPDETAGTLHDKLAHMGAKALTEALPKMTAHQTTLQPQANTGVCYAHKLSKSEARLNWHKPTLELERNVRAFTPWPGAFCFDHQGRRLKLIKARALTTENHKNTIKHHKPGSIILTENKRLSIACLDGMLEFITVQPENGKPMPIEDYLKGYQPQGTFD